MKIGDVSCIEFLYGCRVNDKEEIWLYGLLVYFVNIGYFGYYNFVFYIECECVI